MRAVGTVAAVLAIVLLAAPGALADGDPASDYLISQSAFLPFDAHIDEARATELNQLLAESKKRGFTIKVAVIATRYDLGAVPVLYRQPQRYANFLGQELFYYYKHELLVVMPNGYGVNANGPSEAADLAAVSRLGAPGSTDGNVLVTAAGSAVRTLARKRGIALPAVSAPPSGSSSSSTRDRLEIAFGVALLAVVGGAAGYWWRRSRR